MGKRTSSGGAGGAATRAQGKRPATGTSSAAPPNLQEAVYTARVHHQAVLTDTQSTQAEKQAAQAHLDAARAASSNQVNLAMDAAVQAGTPAALLSPALGSLIAAQQAANQQSITHQANIHTMANQLARKGHPAAAQYLRVKMQTNANVALPGKPITQEHMDALQIAKNQAISERNAAIDAYHNGTGSASAAASADAAWNVANTMDTVQAGAERANAIGAIRTATHPAATPAHSQATAHAAPLSHAIAQAQAAPAVKPAKPITLKPGTKKPLPQGLTFTQTYRPQSYVANNATMRYKEVFGKNAPTDEKAFIAKMGKLIAAPDGTVVKVMGNGPNSFQVHADGPGGFEQQRTFTKHSDGRIEVHNDLFLAGHTMPKETGVNVFARQVVQARKAGVNFISVHAAGNAQDSTYNGYYTWPRFGYDRPLTTAERGHLPPKFKAAHTMQDLFKLDGGADYWKEKGNWHHLNFDLAKDSVSSKMLRQYTKHKGYSVTGL